MTQDATGGTARGRFTLSEAKRRLLDRLLDEQAIGERADVPPSLARIPRRTVEGPAPLTFGQERLWFLDRLRPGSASYNVPRAVRLKGPLQAGILERAFGEIVRRHEILRTRFVMDSTGIPVQLVEPAGSFRLGLVDLSPLPEAGREARALELATEEARSPFDLAAGPPMRARLFRLAPEDHLLVVTMHHIVSDGWSAGILVRELDALIGAFAAGQASPLPELPIQYADYALARRGGLDEEALASSLEFWKGALCGAPLLLPLPADRPRPGELSDRGAHQALAIPPSLAAPLAALARGENATLFMALLAAFGVLLQRLSGRTDVVIGTLIANRDGIDTENLIGFFADTLALRVDLAGNPTFRALLRRVREATLQAYAHKDLPFDRLVAELAPQRDPSHHPVFQVMLLLQNTPAPQTAFSALTATPVETEMGTSRFDLAVALEGGAEGLGGTIEYSTDLFEPRTIERWTEHWTLILEGIGKNPDERLADLPFLPPWQRRTVIDSWSGPARPFPARCAHEAFEEQAARNPDADAVLFEEERIGYGELNASANRLARHLRELGAGAGTVVALHLERSPRLVAAVLGILKSGAACLSLDPSWPAERLAYMLEDARAPLVVTDAEFTLPLPPASRIVRIDRDVPPDADPSDLPPQARPDDVAYLIYTSGSTGRPKGIAMPHRALANLARWHESDPARPRRILQFAALSFDVSYQEILSCLGTGATLVPVPEPIRFDPPALGRLIARAEVERAHLPNVILNGLAEEFQDDPRPLASLREIMVGGEQLQISPALRRLFAGLPRCALHNHYGPSETHVVTSHPLAADPAAWPVLPPLGRPIANARAYVLDAALRPVPIGVAGELYLAGACLARGYLNRPEQTAARFVPDPFRSAGERMYRSGDLVRWLADGTLEFLGRADQQVKIRGMRIEPGEIETVLGRHPSVREAVILARRDCAAQAELVAYVVPRPGSAATAADLRRHLRAALPEYMVPAWFVTRGEFPRTPNGKIDRTALPPPDRERDATGRPHTPPAGAVEERIAAIWREVLGVDGIGVEDRFFDLGGHSLLATTVLARVRDAFGVEIAVRSFFDAPTVRAVAALVEGANGEPAVGPEGAARAIPRLRRGEGTFEQFLKELETEGRQSS